MAQAPTPGRVGSSGTDELTITITVDGDPVVVYPNLLTAKDIAAIRAQSGMSVRKLVELAQEDPDVDVIAALVWIGRCQAGEQASLSEVSQGITYQSKLDLDSSNAPVGVDHPL
jgi:hypothetical protein